MGVETVIRFLFGDAEAIRVVAATNWSIVIGAIFVFSAGLARTWRRKDLWSEPKWLITPFLASLVTSSIFALMLSVWRYRLTDLPNLFPTILGLFWMTAPLAWLYGFPFERCGDRARSIKYRMWTLFVVSMWRVALMIRAVAVVYGVSASDSILFVLMFAGIVAIATLFKKLPKRPTNAPSIFLGMGSLTPETPREVALVDQVFGCAIPILGLVCLFCFFPFMASWQSLDLQPLEGPTVEVSSSLWYFAMGANAFWIVLLPAAQRRQRLRTKLESLIEREEWAQAIESVSELRQEQLPELWVPPLEQELMGAPPNRIVELTKLSERLPTGTWFRSLMHDHFLRYMEDPLLFWLEDDRVEKVAEVVRLLEPPREELAEEALDRVKELKALIQDSRFLSPQEGVEQVPDDSSDPPTEPNLPEDSEARVAITNWYKSGTSPGG